MENNFKQSATAPAPSEVRAQQQQHLSLPVKLPSHGVLYEGKIPDGEVLIYPIRGQQEEILASAGDGGPNTMVVLQHVTQQLVKLPPEFAFQELLVTDWMALLLNILAFSYSSIVTMTPKCPECKTQMQVQKDLKDLDCTYASDLKDGYKEPFKTEPLPRCGEVITFKMLRLRDMAKISEYESKHRARQGFSGIDPSHTYSLAQHIIMIGDQGNMDDLEKMRWIRGALAYDLRVLRTEFEKWETGYDVKPTITCAHCGAYFAVPLPLDFFRQVSSGS